MVQWAACSGGSCRWGLGYSHSVVGELYMHVGCNGRDTCARGAVGWCLWLMLMQPLQPAGCTHLIIRSWTALAPKNGVLLKDKLYMENNEIQGAVK